MSRFDRGTDAKVEEARQRASSISRPAALFQRLRAGHPRRNIAFLALTLMLGTAAVAVAGPSGGFVDGAGNQSAKGIVKFGPINPENGFPDWYRDSRGNEVEPCLQAADPNCNAPEVPDPTKETTFPDNFPGEFFYWMGDAALTANGGNDVLAEYAVEGTFAAEIPRFPDQMVFTRTRYRIRGGLQPDTDYKITNPYGVDVVHTDPGATDLFVTEDVGAAAGAFGSLFDGQVGPLLSWDAGAPAGYLGDPAVAHAVEGSPFGTNFVKVEGPGVGGANNPNPCPGLTATTSEDCIYTELFNITGKESTRGGVEVARATYSRGAAADAKPQIDVLAESKANKDIVVRDTVAGTGRRFQTSALVKDGGRYFTHIDVQGDLPTEVEVLNRSDTPMTVKQVKVVDHLVGSALYDADTDTLHVEAQSSDRQLPLTDLKIEDPNRALSTAGSTDITGVTVPPDAVTVSSKAGGTVSIPVQIQGAGFEPLPLTANPGPAQTVEQGVTVTLDGGASTGNIDGYQWTGPAGITINGANSSKATFTAPSTAGDYTFTLKVDGTDGVPPVPTSKTATVTIRVNPITRAIARIALGGTVQGANALVTVPQNMPLTLDAGSSQGAASFTWSQVSAAPAVDLGRTDGSKLSFTFPKRGTRLVLQVQVRNPGVSPAQCNATRCSTVQIRLDPEPDTLNTTKVRFTPASSRWVIDGTASSTKANHVQVYSGFAQNPDMRIGTSDVLSDGTWSVDARDSVVPVTTCTCVTIVSDRGGVRVDQLEKPNLLPTPTVDPGVATTQAAAAVTPLAAAVPLAGTTFAAARIGAPATVAAGTVASSGVPVTVSVPTGATLLRLRVLTTNNKALFSTFKAVKGGTKVKVNIRSAKLRKQLRSGKRYVIEVRAGTAKNRLGKPTRKVIRIR